MDITFNPAERELLTDLALDKETIEDTLHRILTPMLSLHSEQRLQRLADAYRNLTPDLQIEAIEVLRKWQESKGAGQVAATSTKLF